MPVEVLSALLDISKLSELEYRPNSELPGQREVLLDSWHILRTVELEPEQEHAL